MVAEQPYKTVTSAGHQHKWFISSQQSLCHRGSLQVLGISLACELSQISTTALLLRVSLEERVRKRADRVRLHDLGVFVPDGPRVVLVLLVRARTPPNLERKTM